MDFIINLDKKLFLFLNQSLHTPLLNSIFSFFTYRWNSIIPIIILITYILIKEKENRWYILGGLSLTIIFSDQISSSIFKPLFARPRPCTELSEVFYWNKKHGWRITDDLHHYKKSFSFVSGHAANPTALTTFLFFYYPKFLWFLIPITLLIAYSRIHIGVHYPTDIIGGIIVGVFSGFLGKYTIELLKKKAFKNAK